MRKRLSYYGVFILSFGLAFSTSELSFATPPQGAEPQKATLEGEVRITIAGVRAWDWFDGRFPGGFDKHWVSGGLYRMNVDSFDKESKQKPTGRFWEIPLLLKNEGKQETTIKLADENKPLDIELQLVDGQKIPVRAFRISANLNLAPATLLTSWTGNLGAKLNTGEQAWIMVIFDVPVQYTQGHLRVKNVKFSVSLPREGK
ncbi:MAG TPA: hypothetical protein VGX03_36570 [Candidatus Binatia bacterium]|jgi:hypothetical protein|nr:hypothetical protein [Candidatus Binatia bacterium]